MFFTKITSAIKALKQDKAPKAEKTTTFKSGKFSLPFLPPLPRLFKGKAKPSEASVTPVSCTAWSSIDTVATAGVSGVRPAVVESPYSPIRKITYGPRTIQVRGFRLSDEEWEEEENEPSLRGWRYDDFLGGDRDMPQLHSVGHRHTPKVLVLPFIRVCDTGEVGHMPVDPPPPRATIRGPAWAISQMPRVPSVLGERFDFVLPYGEVYYGGYD